MLVRVFRPLIHKHKIRLKLFTQLNRRYSTSYKDLTNQSRNLSDLQKLLFKKIAACGPISVAEYMKLALTSNIGGYYMNKDVFGAKGDFTTSPEISQIFGELLAIWCMNEWMQQGKSSFRVIELGPGRGTLACDMLRTLSQFPNISGKVSYNLVEVSPFLVESQKKSLLPETSVNANSLNESPITSKYNIPVSWHDALNSVPRCSEDENTFVIAQEFFDALPCHVFRKTDLGYREVLIGLDRNDKLSYTLSPSETVASRFYVAENETRSIVEVSPESGVIVQEISKRISSDGGGALIIDYGHDSIATDSFRSYINHKQIDPLADPGNADLTVDVDFGYLKRCCRLIREVRCTGPVDQGLFLLNMGFAARLSVLLNANPDIRSFLLSGADMLVSKDKMGERFKVMTILPSAPTGSVAGF